MHRYGQTLRYCYEFNQWLAWTGTHWSFDPAIAERHAKDTVLSIYSEVGQLADAKDREILHRHAIFSEQAPRIAAMLSLARSEPGIAIRSGELDRDPWLLNCTNGTIDLTTGELRPHRAAVISLLDDLAGEDLAAYGMPTLPRPVLFGFLKQLRTLLG